MEPEPLAQGDPSPLRRLTASLDALRPVFTNPDLRCVQIGWGAHQFVVWSYSIGLAVYAFEIGGTTAVGLVGLIRLLPAAVAAPFAGLLGDRHSRRAVLMWTTIAMTATVALSAVAVYAGWPAAVVYLLGVGFTVTTAAYAPAQAGLLPVCSRTPQELSACNIALSVMDNAGFLAGSVGAGLLLAAEGPEAVFVLGAVIAAAGGFTLWRVTPDQRPDYAPHAGEAGVVRQTLLGARTVRADPGLRLITVALTALVTFEGMMDVLTVVVALELLGIGEGSVGYLNAAWGAGALVGSAALTVLLKRGALAAGLVAGALITGAATALIGIWPVSAAAFLGLAGIGFGYTFVDVAGNTLLQRLASDEVLSRVFGVLETLRLFAMAIGSIAVPLLVALLGVRGALIAVGAFLPLVAAARWAALRSFEAGAPAPEREYALLRGDPIFLPLPVATLERVSQDLARVEFPAGHEVITEGEPGDLFYLIDQGEVEVVGDGDFRHIAGVGESFGEIALLHDVPRTATVRTTTATSLLTLEREQFLAAVTGHPRSSQVASALAQARLAPSHHPSGFEGEPSRVRNE